MMPPCNVACCSATRCERYPDVLHHVALENPVNDVDPFDDLGEYRVVSVEAQVVLEVDEPLRVARVVTARAHPDGPSDVGGSAELIAKILRQSYVFAGARASALNDEIVLDAMPAQAVVVPG